MIRVSDSYSEGLGFKFHGSPNFSHEKHKKNNKIHQAIVLSHYSIIYGIYGKNTLYCIVSQKLAASLVCRTALWTVLNWIGRAVM